MNGLLSKSVSTKQKLIIFYIDSENQVTQRFVRVLEVHDDHILAYCYYRKKVRTFKLDNILSAGPIRNGVSA
ncbi:hypothetical protein BME96_09075 [Virgibacillus halodenitrificans]|uniref:WYL domain-containing protein n=1 Tax=Virgibacillus halodenitrificans TaxID=1482 RepID=A0AAC9NL22_VIRHA|nr:hypothetical protein [Virgibacillus halodenitrificans]APC48309.1 hypothetical protein BME96_09075 [Virgibacillus halodenitrificans]